MIRKEIKKKFLLPDSKQMKELEKSINPHLQLMEYARNYFRFPSPGTMAEFYFECQDLDIFEEDYDDSNFYETGSSYGAREVNWDDI